MLNIAIDGHVASGKSTLAKQLAEKLNLKMLDTGAIYRSIACAFKETKEEVSDENIDNFVKSIKLEIFFEKELQHVLVNGKDYIDFIRKEEISMFTSKISPFPLIRERVLLLQRKFAEKFNCIMEGRDIGTVVLPNANYKFFITASAEVRAKRRFEQLKNKGENPVFEKVLEDLKQRDYNDENRKIAPLKPAKDAIILDTSNMTLEQSVEYCLNIIAEKNKNSI